MKTQARERLSPLEGFLLGKKGQQIRCNSEADGYSPDERERLRRSRGFRVGTDIPCALILVLEEENHESDLA